MIISVRGESRVKAMRKGLLVILLAIFLAVVPACSGEGDTPDEEDAGVPGDLQEQNGDGSTGVQEPEQDSANRSPTISAVSIEPDLVQISRNSTVRLSAEVTDPDGDSLEYKWAATGGSFDNVAGHRATWRSPELTGSFTVTVTVTDGRGGTATSEIAFTVITNQAPAITSLTASPSLVAPGGHVSVTASAQDPDGDPITYTWAADGGQITGVGSTVTWVAPDVSAGEKTSYIITATADDGRGGTSVETVDIGIAIGYGTRVFNTVSDESGTVIEDGGDETGFFRAGDTVDNETMRAFFSFDLSDVADSDVSEATVRFTHAATVGDPFYQPTGLGGVRVFVVRYEEGGLADLYTDPRNELTERVLMESPTEFDIAKFVQRIGEGSAYSDRMQFMMRFQKETNNDNVTDYMEWSQAVVTVTYAPD